jgi:hypothetical protein
MSDLIDIVHLEAQINRCLGEDPPVDGELSPTLAAMAEVYALMIFRRQRDVEVALLPEAARAALTRQLASGSGGAGTSD